MALVGLDQLTLGPFLPQAKTLVMAGKRRSDRYHLSTVALMAKLIPDSQMVTLDDGHLFLPTKRFRKSARLSRVFGTEKENKELVRSGCADVSTRC